MKTFAQQSQSPPPHNIYRSQIPNTHDQMYRPAQNGAHMAQYPGYQSHTQQPSHTDPALSNYQPHGLPPPPGSRPALEQTQAGPTPVHSASGSVPLAPGIQPVPAEPMSFSKVVDGRRYELFVRQEPKRARMCGFGDKDRRPITPPPCVQLVITDVKTGKEVDSNEVVYNMFVINVDLWSSSGTQEVNLVRHSTSPAISATTPPVNYSESVNHPAPAYQHNVPQQNAYEPGHQQQVGPYSSFPGPPQVNPYSGQQGAPQSGFNQHNSYPQPINGQNYQQSAHEQAYPSHAPNTQYAQPSTGQYPPHTSGQSYAPSNGYSQPGSQTGYYQNGPISAHVDYPPPNQQPPSHQYAPMPSRPYTPQEMAVARGHAGHSSPQGMFTRNLIGSLSASAFRLTDYDDKIGIWFVLQDLSVRTEGSFRLRFSFVDVGIPSSPGSHGSAQKVNTGKTPVLASCFSDIFQVHSAKKFPGVVESTPLSKCFATQGIKIPIRKEGPGKGDRDRDEED
ncbi:hypothetical protein PZA11_000813 [Diplocarpon coronariae]|uniref:Velvet domain-containing protein n=1 Tax=Diplocarpon coronariae TaxID=2795749 RepID=A0A218Z1X8_9HELO|nr:hypothetical protein B2J93_4574 [Marssonina coronariae]